MDQQLIYQLIFNISTIIGLVLSGLIIAFLRKKIGITNLNKVNKEMQITQEMARLAVLFIQKKYKTANSDIKFNKAFNVLTEMFNKKGLSLTETEIQVLIESTLKMLKKQYGSKWKKVAN